MRAPALLGLVAVALLGACGTADEDAAGAAPSMGPTPTATPTATPTPTPAASPSGTPSAVVPEELDFTAATVGGGTFEGASLAGRPAVLWFWAPWCPVCRREAPLIADLAARYEGEVAFIGVAGLSGDLAAMEGFVADGGVEAIPHLDDRDGEVYSRFGVTQQYDIGLVSADGTVEVVRGPLDEDEIVAAVESLATG